MTDVAEKQATLADKHVWIIDDEIPIERAEFEHSDMVEGKRPIDHGALLALLLQHEDWGDYAVRDLCEQLVEKAGNVLAFPQPAAAVDHLNQGGMTPDVVVFDLKYRRIQDKAIVWKYLEDILCRCVSVVQVYAQEPDVVSAELQRVQDRFPTRMQPPLRKADIRAEDLAKALGEKLESSLSAQLAGRIRRLSSEAVENVLVKIDDLPLDVAIRLMVGKIEELPSDTELVELLSVKVGDAIKSTPELTEAIGRYATDRGVPSDRVPQFVGEMVDLLAANVRERIQYEGWLYKTIRLVWENVDPNRKDGDDEIGEIVRNFFAFRVYDRPGDDLVRTGDIILLLGEDAPQDEPPELYLVLTPPCDLARFWYNTRGVLTLAKMHPITESKGVKRVKSYDHSGFDSSSITARNPMILPSIPLSEGELADYVLFVYEIGFEEFDGYILVEQIEGKKKRRARFRRQLTYDELKGLGWNCERKCRISEPFLSGVLAALENQLFRTGVPDFPDEEEKRLKGLFD